MDSWGRYNHGRPPARERQRQNERHRLHDNQAEDFHRCRRVIRYLNHNHKRYLGLNYPEHYPEFIPRHLNRGSDRCSA